MANHIIQSIKAYIKTYQNPYHQIKVIHMKDKIDYYMICYEYCERDICIIVYNDTFIKINVDNHIYAICDGIKTVRYELDKIGMYRDYASYG
jgi:hypothetical protein